MEIKKHLNLPEELSEKMRFFSGFQKFFSSEMDS